MNANARISVGAINTPKRSDLGGRIILRYGYQPMAAGYAKYVEHQFMQMPREEDFRLEVEEYCNEVGVNCEYNKADYGY